VDFLFFLEVLQSAILDTDSPVWRFAIKTYQKVRSRRDLSFVYDMNLSCAWFHVICSTPILLSGASLSRPTRR
jgi:hypothetical protein